MATFFRYPVYDNGVKISTPAVVVDPSELASLFKDYQLVEDEDTNGKFIRVVSIASQETIGILE